MKSIIPIEKIEQKIFYIRNQKVMFDKYYERKQSVGALREASVHLKRQVRRNINRFPEDFMFQLNSEELKILIFQIGITKKGKIPLGLKML